ncbi:MAG: alkene reductase [Gammaproteobacteria bacterium]|nr:alkene reductase [Gammaproteobacteria bacterium]
MSTTDLFSSITVGKLKLSNRMVMAPMTRNRAAEGNIPQQMNIEYYRQRARDNFIITEASQVSAEGVGYPATPGIYNEQQVAGWRKITDAVHDEGGRIYLQLWYCGRISHPDLLPDKQTPVAPSALTPEGEAITFEGMKAFVEPHALETDEIQNIVLQYKNAAQMSKQAGFDGVEIHAANGYLIDQFLRDGSNQRDDSYGGSEENRMRFLNQVIDAVLEVWHSSSVGIRLSPENSFNSMSDSDPQAHFSYFIEQLNRRNLAYLHMLEGDMISSARKVNYRSLRDSYNGIYIANNGYDKERGQAAIANGDCDLVAYGIPFIANPDLPHRYKNDLPLNQADQATFYGGDETGYTDYPFAE